LSCVHDEKVLFFSFASPGFLSVSPEHQVGVEDDIRTLHVNLIDDE